MVGRDATEPGELRRVTTPSSARRAAMVVLSLLVALVGLSLVWDVGQDGAADDTGLEEDRPTTTGRPRHRATTTTLASRAVPVPLADPVPAFGDEWLVVVDNNAMGVWQLPLSGGHAVRLGGLREGPVSWLIDGQLIGSQGGVSLRDGTSWRPQLPAEEDTGGSMPGSRWSWIIGRTDSDTLVAYDEQRFVELAADGSSIGTVAAPVSGGIGNYPRAVVGRRILFEGSHGLFIFDLDTAEMRRVATGSFIAAVGERLVVEVCDDAMRCTTRLVDLDDGVTRMDLPSVSTQPFGLWRPWMMPSASPDGERLALFHDDHILMVDLVDGHQIGAIALPPEVLEGEPMPGSLGISVVWSRDSAAALVLVTRNDGRLDNRGVRFAAWTDRDLAIVQRRDDLAATLTPVVRPGGGEPTFFLSAESFEPWTR